MDMDIDVDPRILALSYRDLQKKCKEHALPATGNKAALQKNLDDYLNNPRETLKRLAREANKKKNGHVDWKKSAAREILLEDLEPPKGLLCGLDLLAARDVYDYYKVRYEDIFEDIPFKQFETKCTEAVKKASQRRSRSDEEAEKLKHDRCLHPRQTHNHRGEPVWDMDEEAKAQLTKDINNKLHEKMGPMALWQSRDVCMKYKLIKFRPRTCQHQRRVKFLNCLEKKRTEKRDEFAAKMTPKEVTFTRVDGKAKKIRKGTKIRGESRQSKRSKRN